jgi:hypothetical protein
MSTCVSVDIRTEVYDKLAAKKAGLETIYKRNFTWSHFFDMLLHSGAVEKISAQDIDGYGHTLEEAAAAKEVRV